MEKKDVFLTCESRNETMRSHARLMSRSTSPPTGALTWDDPLMTKSFLLFDRHSSNQNQRKLSRHCLPPEGDYSEWLDITKIEFLCQNEVLRDNCGFVLKYIGPLDPLQFCSGNPIFSFHLTSHNSIINNFP